MLNSTLLKLMSVVSLYMLLTTVYKKKQSKQTFRFVECTGFVMPIKLGLADKRVAWNMFPTSNNSLGWTIWAVVYKNYLGDEFPVNCALN